MMAEGRQRDEWNHTSHLLAWIENYCFRWRSKKAEFVSARSRNPTAPKETPLRVPLSILSAMFTKKN
jgi:hypothetical protein